MNYEIKTTDGTYIREHHRLATSETVRETLLAIAAYLQRDDATIVREGDDLALRGPDDELIAYAVESKKG